MGFPDHVDKLIINSPMPPLPDSLEMAKDAAHGTEMLWDNIAWTCDFMGEACPVKGQTAEAMKKVTARIRSQKIVVPLTPWYYYSLLNRYKLNECIDKTTSYPATFLLKVLLGRDQQPS